MSRFTRASRIPPRTQYEQLLRRAWQSLWLTGLALLGAAILLTRRPHPPRPAGSSSAPTFLLTVAAPADPAEPAPPPHTPLIPPPHAWELPPLPQLEAPLPPPAEATALLLPDLPQADSPAPSLLPDTLTAAPAPPAPSRPRPATASAAAAPTAAAAATAGTTGEYTPPAYRHTPKPPYPPAMRQSRLEGSVRLRISISATGRPEQVEILTGSGHTAFDTTAQAWILRHWQFEPARRGGRAVPSRVITSIRFELKA